MSTCYPAPYIYDQNSAQKGLKVAMHFIEVNITHRDPKTVLDTSEKFVAYLERKGFEVELNPAVKPYPDPSTPLPFCRIRKKGACGLIMLVDGDTEPQTLYPKVSEHYLQADSPDQVFMAFNLGNPKVKVLGMIKAYPAEAQA